MIAVDDPEGLDIFEILISPNHVQKIELDIHRMLFEKYLEKNLVNEFQDRMECINFAYLLVVPTSKPIYRHS